MSIKSYFSNSRQKLKKRKRLIVFLSVLTLLGMTTATFARFTVNTFAGIQIFELQISTGDDLRVSMENHGSDIDQYTHVTPSRALGSGCHLKPKLSQQGQR